MMDRKDKAILMALQNDAGVTVGERVQLGCDCTVGLHATITAGQTLSVSETATNGTGVGAVATTGDSPTTFTITAGNTGSAFAIDNAGNVTVNDASVLDFDTAPATYALTVQVGDGTSTSTETVTVNLTDVAPAITAGQTFSVSETLANGTGVGSVTTGPRS